MGDTVQYSYDQAGQLVKRTDAAGNTKTYAYDAAGNLTTESHYLNGTALDERTTYSYDADGKLIGYTQNDGNGNLISSASYTKDAQGRTIRSAITYGKADGSGTLTFNIGQSFNVDGQLSGNTYPDGTTAAYSYSQGRLSQITLPNGSTVSYQNYNWQVPASIQTPGTTETLSTDALQRPTLIAVQNAANQTLASRQYQYDAAGNILQINSDIGQTQYSYDALNRLTRAAPDQSLQATGLPVEQYQYDPVGNRTSSLHQGGFWTYNADNELTRYPQLAPFNPQAAPLDTQVTYTAQGDTASETNSQTQNSYGYNAAERLVQYSSTPAGASTPDVQASYRYDPFGRRIAKSVTKGNVTTTTYFIYSNTGLMAEANGQGQLTRAYGFNPVAAQQNLWSTSPVWQADVANGSLTDTGTSYDYLYTDHLSTPILAVDKQGSVSWKAVAEAFGSTGVLPGNSITMNLRFPGQYFDEESGDHYNFLRTYNPRLGSYITQDPIGIAGGLNLFAYVAANPLVRIDPFGLQPFDNGESFIHSVAAPIDWIDAEPPQNLLVCQGNSVCIWAVSNIDNSNYSILAPNSEARGKHIRYLWGRLSEKCNKFVWDATVYGGKPPGRMHDGRIPSASEWGNPKSKIAGYIPLPSGAPIVPGDIVGDGRHVGIYVPLSDGSPGTVSAGFPFTSKAAGVLGHVVHNDWGFRPGQTVTIWEPKN